MSQQLSIDDYLPVESEIYLATRVLLDARDRLFGILDDSGVAGRENAIMTQLQTVRNRTSLGLALRAAQTIMLSRAPDQQIYSLNEDDESRSLYLRRWRLPSEDDDRRCYLHEFVSGEDTINGHHSHPCNSLSWQISGILIEQTESGLVRVLRPGTHVLRHYGCRHIIRSVKQPPVLTLVVTGPKIRDWGFWQDGVFIPWQAHERRVSALPVRENQG